MNVPVATARKNRTIFNDLVEMIQPTIMKAISDTDFLLDIPIACHSGNPQLSVKALSKITGVSKSSIIKLEKQGCFKGIYEALAKVDIVKPGLSSLTCNNLRLLERAKRYISTHREVLKQIPIIGGRISVFGFERLSFAKLLDMSYFSKAVSRYDKDNPSLEFYNDFLRWVFEQIVYDGHFDNDSYVSRVNKLKQRKKFVKGASASAIFMVAREHEGYTNSISSLGNVEGFNALMALFALTSRRVTSLFGVNNYKNSFTMVKKFLEATNVCHSSALDIYLNKYTSIRFRAYIEDVLLEKKLSPTLANTYLSCLNLALKRLSEFKEFNDKVFLYASGFNTGSSSQKAIAFTPYTSEERNIIQAKIDVSIEKLKYSWLSPYVKSEKVHDFIKLKGDKVFIVSESVTMKSLKSWFDNECDSMPFYFHASENANLVIQRKIFKRAMACIKMRKEFDGNIKALWELWRVPSRMVTPRDLIPLFLKLIQVTGMNPSSVIDLEIDDFVLSHDATNRPCLRYWKERSTGGKEYHLDIFKCDITWLTLGQAENIKNIFDMIRAMTKHVRRNASDKIQNKLFICNNINRHKGDNIKWHEPISLQLDQVAVLLKELSTELTYENGKKIDVVTTRFRSSFVSELVDQGVPLREIQMVMGHANITTTIAYLDRMDFNKLARQKIFTALTQIYSNSYSLSNKPQSQDVNINNIQEVIYKTPLGGCKNIFEPPGFIQAVKGYEKGSACSNFNKCLSCNNVIITKSQLPDLFALYRDYLQVTRNARLMNTPHGKVIKENLDILECVLGERSEFSESELEIAKRLSFNIESTILIDGVSL